jgi:ankyrin repeat protein
MTSKDIAGIDKLGRSSLHYAANEANVGRVRELLASGADSNLQDKNGWSPLHFAAQASSHEVTELLLASGASVHLRDSFGNTALFRAVFSSKGIGTVIQALRAAGADPKAVNAHGVSPHQLARTIANYDVAKFFADV